MNPCNLCEPLQNIYITSDMVKTETDKILKQLYSRKIIPILEILDANKLIFEDPDSYNKLFQEYMTKIEAINNLILAGTAIPLERNNDSILFIKNQSNKSFTQPPSLPLPTYSRIMLAPSLFNKNTYQNS